MFMLSCQLLLPCTLYNALKESVVQLNEHILKGISLLKKQASSASTVRCNKGFFSSTFFVRKDTLSMCQSWIYLHNSGVFLNKCLLNEFSQQK